MRPIFNGRVTIMPFLSLLPSAGLRSPSPFRIFTRGRFLTMADQTQSDSPRTQFENDPKSLVNYPVPLSPPLPSISKDIELSRAMSASSKSSLFSLSRSDVLFEDDWLMAVNKPQGVYCESVLASVPSLLNDSTDSDKLGEWCYLCSLIMIKSLEFIVLILWGEMFIFLFQIEYYRGD